MDSGLVGALLERWIPATQSWVFPTGEVLPLPEDWVRITGMPFGGRPVTGVMRSHYQDSCEAIFGRRYPFIASSGTGQIRASWFIDEFATGMVPVRRLGEWDTVYVERERAYALRPLIAEPGAEADLEIRAFFMYFFAQMLFSTTSRGMITGIFLSLLLDIDRIGEFAWGAAALAHLYTQMFHHAAGTQTIGGFLPFIQFWAYEHFAFLRPRMPSRIPSAFPRMKVWRTLLDEPLRSADLHVVRGLFEDLHQGQVIWRPYADDDDAAEPVIVSERRFFRVAIWVHCFERIERIHTDRVVC
eukprot:TRINITY_DN233_c1_g1_i1.p1 TRINITY_DN233_c1_g1~~TRINITY_DN233_c1_g1_i1.p1  ORF type:complete len:300 (+),score=7.63 TRINITY_DN233_c1_g1_i1:714-1613(+)